MDTTMRAIEYPSAVTYLSLRDLLCNAAGCLTSVGPDLEHDLVVWDYGHLTAAASNFVAHALIEPAISEILKPPSAVTNHEALARP